MWIDDQAEDRDREWRAAQPEAGEHLLIIPHVVRGLAPEGFEAVMRWAEAHALSASSAPNAR